MNIDLKHRWLDALRSGKYRQGKNSLRYNDEFCCLGVLADVQDHTQWRGNASGTCWKWGEDRDYERFGGASLQQFGLSENHQESLIGLNDNNGKTFPEIADWIQKYVSEDV